MAVKNIFFKNALASLEKATIVVIIPQGKKVINGIEYDLVEKIPFYSKKGFLRRKKVLRKKLEHLIKSNKR